MQTCGVCFCFCCNNILVYLDHCFCRKCKQNFCEKCMSNNKKFCHECDPKCDFLLIQDRCCRNRLFYSLKNKLAISNLIIDKKNIQIAKLKAEKDQCDFCKEWFPDEYDE